MLHVTFKKNVLKIKMQNIFVTFVTCYTKALIINVKV